jgi:hypothetical protein
MRNGEFVTLKRLNAAFGAVQTELDRRGLWQAGSRLQSTDVIWCPWPQLVAPAAVGFCFDNPTSAPWRWLGYHGGNIYIPQWVLSHGPWGQARGSLRDVLRHEFGHALAWHYPALIRRSRQFAAAFGGRYDDPTPVPGPDAAFVSEYARTCPAEDFAETFMVYLRQGGRRPERLRHARLRRKWAYVRAVVRAIAAGRSRLVAPRRRHRLL